MTAATEDQLIVQYYPGIGNVTNHFIIPVSEAAEGQWEIRWSSDMTDIQEYNIKTCPFQCIRRFPVRLAGGSPGADAV